jgi:hypothetical protein
VPIYQYTRLKGSAEVPLRVNLELGQLEEWKAEKKEDWGIRMLVFWCCGKSVDSCASTAVHRSSNIANGRYLHVFRFIIARIYPRTSTLTTLPVSIDRAFLPHSYHQNPAARQACIPKTKTKVEWFYFWQALWGSYLEIYIYPCRGEDRRTHATIVQSRHPGQR